MLTNNVKVKVKAKVKDNDQRWAINFPIIRETNKVQELTFGIRQILITFKMKSYYSKIITFKFSSLCSVDFYLTTGDKLEVRDNDLACTIDF